MKTPTDLNMFVFDREFGSFSPVPASSRFDVTSLPHLKRCVAAGYVVRDGEWLRVTAEGEAALAAYRGRRRAC